MQCIMTRAVLLQDHIIREGASWLFQVPACGTDPPLGEIDPTPDHPQIPLRITHAFKPKRESVAHC